MKELSLHILDIVQNSIKANATKISVTILESIKDNVLTITIDDNGCGMDEETVKKVRNPFYTTRTTRKVGLGIPLLMDAANRCNGYFNIHSRLGVGTNIECSFERNNIDRAPLGDISGTILTIINSIGKCDFIFKYITDFNEFELSTIKVKEILGSSDISTPDVLLWLKEYIEEAMKELRAEAK